LVSAVFRSPSAPQVPWTLRLLFKIPIVRDLPARLLGFGIRPAQVKE